MQAVSSTNTRDLDNRVVALMQLPTTRLRAYAKANGMAFMSRERKTDMAKALVRAGLDERMPDVTWCELHA